MRWARWIRDLFRRPPILHIAEDVGDGPVLVLLHGIASSAATFQSLVPLLSEKYRCISIDLLGFGESPAPENAQYTIDEHVASIAATLRSLRLSAPVILAGHSLGALLAARLAATYPSKVRRLVMISPPVYLAEAEIGDPLVRAQVGAYLKAYEFMRENKEFTITNAARIAKILQISTVFGITERNWNAFILSLKNCIESQTTVSDIAAVRVPIDVIYGALDQFMAPGTMNIVEQMRHVTMHRVEVNDHLVRPRLARAVARAIG